MKFISSVRTSAVQQVENLQKSRTSAPLQLFAAFAFAVTLALAPLPTFAQHGGGGGGGGAHGGGGGGGHMGSGGGGGSHGGGSGSPPSHTSAPASNHPVATGTNPSSNSGSGANHGSNPTNQPAATGTNATGPSDHVGGQAFAGNNNTWQEPPASAAQAGRHAATPTKGVVAAPRAAVATPPHVPVPRRPVYAPYYPYYPFYPGFGFGYGFGGGFFYGGYGPCDPFWGCYGYGYGYGGGIGYGYYGGNFSPAYSADLNYSGGDDTTPSQEPSPSLFAEPTETLPQDASTSGPSKPVVAVLYLKNGSSYAVTDYWLADGKVHYITSYGGENSIDEKDLDLQRSVNENAAQGLTFTLRPAASDAPVNQQ